MTNKTLAGKNFLICGGSIAGCAIAILLQRLGANVEILEKSSTFEGRGAGIVLPENFVEQCIHLDLFDTTIPRLKLSARTFYIKEESENNGQPWGKAIWHQPSFNVSALNWNDIYQQLRKRIPNHLYKMNCRVTQFEEDSNLIHLVTDNKTYGGDFCIAADGVDSQIRRQIFPTLRPTYVNYVAWRGLLSLDDNIMSHFEHHIPYYVFSNGHILLYLIPMHTSGDNKQQKPLLNWVLYESVKKNELQNLLIDKKGEKHSYAIRPGMLSQQHIDHLYQLAKNVLPENIVRIIYNTEKPFLQVVFDFQLETFVKNKAIFIGDAAAVLRPHTASGTLKALSDSISLYSTLSNIRNADNTTIMTACASWNDKQKHLIQNQTDLAVSMGNALVTDTPAWQHMSEETMESWWQTVMQGKKWYATRQ